ncbi:MAG: hypothetical protein QM734_10420 [Cyclobacteriaceae bacterium]
MIDEIQKHLGNWERKAGIKLYMTVGELEVSESQSNDLKKIVSVLTDKTIDVETEVYKSSEHMGTAIPSFEKGIQIFMRK